jgi:hypothetical protein
VGRLPAHQGSRPSRENWRPFFRDFYAHGVELNLIARDLRGKGYQKRR